MTVKIYDISIDEMRDVTQEDIDRLEKTQQIAGKMVHILRRQVPNLIPDPGPNFQKQLDERLDAYIKEHILSHG